MPNLFLPDNAEKVLGALRHGAGLAQDRRGDKAGPADVIWCLIEEAVNTMDRMPDREKAWQSIGSVAAGFGGNGLTHAEMKALEQLRYLSAMKPYDGPTAQVIDRDQADRAFEVLLWLRWIGVHVTTRDPERMRRAAVALARGGDSEIFHRIWRPGRKPYRQAVWEFRIQLAGHIRAGLERDLGIVLGPGVAASEQREPAFV